MRQREVRIRVDAATLTLPPGRGRFPAVAMVRRRRREHRPAGAGRAAWVAFLDTLPQIDRKRVGVFGDSQAGWISTLAASRDRAIHFVISNVGPTVSVGESDDWASLAHESEGPPSATRAQMLAQVQQAGPSGFDTAPALRRLTIPALWLFGADDRNVPTELCIERLQAPAGGHDFGWVVVSCAHTPFLLPNGLLSSLPQSPGFDPRFLPAIGDWLRGHGITR